MTATNSRSDKCDVCCTGALAVPHNNNRLLGCKYQSACASTTSRRSYKEPWPDERVAEFLREQSGRHFDPELVEIALDLLGYFRSVRSRFSSDGS